MDPKRGENSKFIKHGVLIWLTLQNSVHTVVLRYSRSRPVSEMFLPSVAVFFMEIVKLVICLFLVCFEKRSFRSGLRDVYQLVALQPMDTLKVGVPSFIYTLQNNLFYLAASHLEAATFMVLSQLKILTTALFTVAMLRRSLSTFQWISLLTLFVGVSLVQYQESSSGAIVSKKGSPHEQQSPLIGLTAVSAACLLSGFAGVYFEKILKKPVDVSLWVRNVQLAAMSVPISACTMFAKDGTFLKEHGLLYGFDGFVWFVIFWYGIGGLTVAACIKFADNIAKNFATSFAIVLSTIFSVYIFDFKPNFLFVLGALVVIGSIFLYSKQQVSSIEKVVVTVPKKLTANQMP